MTNKFLILATLLLGAFVARAEGVTGAGDGGHGVGCKRSHRSYRHIEYRIEVLDLFEARRLYGQKHFRFSHDNLGETEDLPLEWGQVALTLEIKMNAMRELFGNSPILSAFSDAIHLSEHVRLTNDLRETRDSGVLQTPLPSGCKIIQIGVREKTRDGEVFWLERSHLWYLSRTEFAALLLHESLHKYFDDKDSTLVIRQFVAFTFASREFQTRNMSAFRRLLATRKPLRRSEFQ